MFAIVICLVLLICTLTIRSFVLRVLIIEGMSVVVNVMLSLMNVMRVWIICVDGRSRYLCIVHGGYLHI